MVRKGQFFIISAIFIVVTVLSISSFLGGIDKEIEINPVDKLSLTYMTLRSFDNDARMILEDHRYVVDDATILDLNHLAYEYVDVLSKYSVFSNIFFYINDSKIILNLDVSDNQFHMYKEEVFYP